MIDLYAAPTSNGLRAKIMLDECGLDYTLHPMDLAAGAHKKPDYLAINPMGLIPTIVDSDGPDGKPFTLSQSMAILVYLAGKSGKFLPENLSRDMIFWRDLMSICTDMTGNLMGLLTIARLPEPDQASMDTFGNRFNELLKVWDGLLADRKYAAGAEVSIADFAFYPVMFRCKGVAPQYAQGCPNVDRWFEETGARPGVQKGVTFA